MLNSLCWNDGQDASESGFLMDVMRAGMAGATGAERCGYGVRWVRGEAVALLRPR